MTKQDEDRIRELLGDLKEDLTEDEREKKRLRQQIEEEKKKIKPEDDPDGGFKGRTKRYVGTYEYCDTSWAEGFTEDYYSEKRKLFFKIDGLDAVIKMVRKDDSIVNIISSIIKKERQHESVYANNVQVAYPNSVQVISLYSPPEVYASRSFMARLNEPLIVTVGEDLSNQIGVIVKKIETRYPPLPYYTETRLWVFKKVVGEPRKLDMKKPHHYITFDLYEFDKPIFDIKV